MEPFTQPPEPFAPEVRAEFGVDPDLIFLNHGSFGSVPRCVRAAQDVWRDRLERDPIELIGRRIQSLLGEVKLKLASRFGGAPSEYGFVTNATEGVNAVLRSMRFEPGDELLCTDHVYRAVRQAMRSRAGECAAVVRDVPVPLPTLDADALLHAVLAGVNERTRLLVLDHVTSATATRFPVEALRAKLPPRCALLVDGAHAPGAMPLDVHAIGAEFYAANLHKWVMAPKGSAFLHVRADQAASTHPCVISHFFGEGFEPEFDWQGTRDMAAWMTAGFAIDFMAQFGWPAVQTHNRQMAAWVQRMLCERWELDPVSPMNGCMLGSMCTVPLPAEIPARFAKPEEFQEALYREHMIELPVIDFGGRGHVRPSAQLYNRAEQYDRLAHAVLEYAAHV